MNELYDFPSPGKTYKKVKAVKLQLTNRDGIQIDHLVPVYLHAAGTPTFCIVPPADYVDTWKNHPPKEEWLQNAMRISFDYNDRIIRAADFDKAVDALTKLSNRWRSHHAERTMERCIYVVLELKSQTVSISPPSFSSSSTLVGLTVRWGYRVGGREYSHRNSVDDPLDPELVQPDFRDLNPYSGTHHGRGVTLPFTNESWLELLKIQDTLERAADRLALLGKADSAALLLSSLASGTPLLAAPQ